MADVFVPSPLRVPDLEGCSFPLGERGGRLGTGGAVADFRGRSESPCLCCFSDPFSLKYSLYQGTVPKALCVGAACPEPTHVRSVRSCTSLPRAPRMTALGMACRHFRISAEAPSLPPSFPFQLPLPARRCQQLPFATVSCAPDVGSLGGDGAAQSAHLKVGVLSCVHTHTHACTHAHTHTDGAAQSAHLKVGVLSWLLL